MKYIFLIIVVDIFLNKTIFVDNNNSFKINCIIN